MITLDQGPEAHSGTHKRAQSHARSAHPAPPGSQSRTVTPPRSGQGTPGYALSSPQVTAPGQLDIRDVIGPQAYRLIGTARQQAHGLACHMHATPHVTQTCDTTPSAHITLYPTTLPYIRIYHPLGYLSCDLAVVFWVPLDLVSSYFFWGGAGFACRGCRVNLFLVG
jgi:hypothetical protein